MNRRQPELRWALFTWVASSAEILQPPSLKPFACSYCRYDGIALVFLFGMNRYIYQELSGKSVPVIHLQCSPNGFGMSLGDANIRKELPNTVHKHRTLDERRTPQ